MIAWAALRAEKGGGLRALSDPVEALGGQLTLAGVAGSRTTVRARVPVARERGTAVAGRT